MSSRGNRIIWLKVKTGQKKGRGVNLNFPVSLNVILELLSCLGDITSVLSVISPVKPASPRFTIRSFKELLGMLEELIGSVADEEPYEMLIVTDCNVHVSIRVG